MRRFLLHVLPDGFHRIRHYGLFANGHRAAMLARCRELLDVPPAPAEVDDGESNDSGTARRRRCPPAHAAAGRCGSSSALPGPSSRRYPARKPDGW